MRKSDVKRHRFIDLCESDIKARNKQTRIDGMAERWFNPPNILGEDEDDNDHVNVNDDDDGFLLVNNVMEDNHFVLPKIPSLAHSLAERGDLEDDDLVEEYIDRTTQRRQLEACQFVLIDIGAHKGEGLNELIDAGIPMCLNRSYSFSMDVLKVEAAEEKAEEGKISLSSTKFLRDRMANISSILTEDLYPEHYCYVGVEADPRLKFHLSAIRDIAYTIHPRPLYKVRFYTNTAVTDVFGKAKFYVDEQDPGRSSILMDNSGHRTHDIQVYSTGLTGLLHRHVAIGPGSHVVVKAVNLRGGEYRILNAAYDTGALCALAGQIYYFDIIISKFHSLEGKTDHNDQIRFAKEVFPALKACGVNFFHTDLSK